VNSALSNTSVTDDRWHHITVTYDQNAGGYIGIYTDSVLTGLNYSNDPWTWPAGQPIELGHSHDTHWKSFDGLLDDVRIYNRILTDPEIVIADATGALIDTSALKVRLNFDTKPILGVGISWNASGAVLQSATAVTGPFTDVSPAVPSPYYQLAQPSPKFFRYRRSPVSLQSNPYDM
jgi:hypothetical protein